MRKFEVHFDGIVIIEAETLREANEKFTDEHPLLDATDFYDCDAGRSIVVIGYCEASGLCIFKGDEFEVDNENAIMILKEFIDDDETK